MNLPDKEDFLKFLADVLSCDPGLLTLDQPFPEPVFDSTSKLMLSMAIESELGTVISIEDISRFRTPGDIYAFLSAI